MNAMNFETGDITIRVDGDQFVDIESLGEDLIPSSRAPDAVLNITLGYAISEEVRRPKYFGDNMSVLMSDNDGAGWNLFPFFIYLNFLAGQVSGKYMSCHGIGLRLDGKGVLIIGAPGSHKSTLAGILGGEIVNDDFLLVTPNQMERITRSGKKVDPKTRNVEDVYTAHPCPIDYVFVLDKSIMPESAVEIPHNPHSILSEWTFDSYFLHHSLLRPYKGRGSIEFEAPVYLVGTGGDMEHSKKIIEDIISQ